MDLQLINWGASFWRCIHYLAIHEKRDIIEKLPEHIPCKTCKDEFVGVSAEEDLVDWSIREHNRVNGKLGKWDKWDRIDFNISHKPTCDICEGKEYVFGFPWTFLNTISINTDRTDSLVNSNSRKMTEHFIKEFVDKYPCEICRGKLIIDFPYDNETFRDWVHRNHIRFNNERGLPEPNPINIIQGTDIGSSNISMGCTDCPN